MKAQLRIAMLPLFLLLCLTLAVVPSKAVSIGTLYSNGPSSPTDSNAWEINFGSSVTNSFWVPPNSSITSLTFQVWVNPGVTLTSVDAQFGTTAFGGSPETLAGLSGVWGGTKFGFDVYNITADFPDVPWSGDGWLTFRMRAPMRAAPPLEARSIGRKTAACLFPTAHCPSLAFTNASYPDHSAARAVLAQVFPAAPRARFIRKIPTSLATPRATQLLNVAAWRCLARGSSASVDSYVNDFDNLASGCHSPGRCPDEEQLTR